MWEHVQSIGVAVSGGADSVALLHMLLRKERFRLTVLHVNYGWRGAESDADEAFVRNLAAKLQLRVLVHQPAPQPGNGEETARKARYRWFRTLIDSGLCERVAVGHTASDQAETVLFRFLRGAGTAGLAAMRSETPAGIIRPLLHLTRADVVSYLEQHNLLWREDSSNEDETFRRNRIRHSLLPALTRDWNPRLPQLLCQTAEWARAEEDYWRTEAERLAGSCIHRESAAELIIDVEPLNHLPLAAIRRLIRLFIERVKGSLQAIDFAHVEAVRALAARPAGNGRIALPGLTAHRSQHFIRLFKPAPLDLSYNVALPVPGEFIIPGTGCTLHMELKDVNSVYNRGGQLLDWGRVSGPLRLRNWHPGDRYQRSGRSDEEKLKILFQKSGIPAWERLQWPVIVQDNSIVWTRQFGPAQSHAVSTETRVVLMIGESPNQNQ